MVLTGTNLFSTDATRDEFFRGTADKAIISYPVGYDLTEGSITDSTTETEVLDLVIESGSVINGIRIKALVQFRQNQTASFRYGLFKVKAGDDGSEALLTQVVLYCGDDGAQSVWIEAIISDLNWDKEQSVSITATNSYASAQITSYGAQLIVDGF